MSRTWWYVLVGGFGVRWYDAGGSISREQAVKMVARRDGVHVSQVEQCWPFRQAEDVYQPGMYGQRRRA